MIDEILIVFSVVIGIGGLLLLADVARIRLGGADLISDPERQQLVVGLAMVAFAGAFFAGRGGDAGVEAPAEPVAEAPRPAPAELVDAATTTRLAAAARLPKLRRPSPPRRPPADERRKPEPAQPEPVVEETPVEPVEEIPEPAVEPAAAPEPAPAPAPTPAPEPEPPVAFDDSG